MNGKPVAFICHLRSMPMVAGASLALEGIVQLATLASFGYVGQMLRARHTRDRDADVARRAVVAWWWCLGAYLGMLGVLDLLASAGIAPLALHLAARIVGVPLLAGCAWGFCTYVLYLYAGSVRGVWWVGAYGVLAALAFYLETWIDRPTSVAVGAWSSGLAPPADLSLLRAVYAFFAIPLLLAILAYASLYMRVRDPLQRYRIALVSSSLLAWVVGGFAGSSSGNGLAEFAAVTLLGLVAAGAVLLAYRPPHALLARLAPGSPEALASTRRVAGRRDQMQRRVAELV